MKLRVVDFETTGTAPPAEVVEVGTCDLVNVPPWTVGQPMSRLFGVDALTAETRAVHHIAPAEVAGLPKFDVRDLFAAAIEDGVLGMAAHHANFESQWLGKLPDGIHLICTYKCALRVWPDAPAHGNQFLRYWLEEQGLTAPDAGLCQPAHRAGPDAYATAWLLAALLDKASGKELVAWTKEPAALPRCTIGKERGKKWDQVDGGFLDWMLRQRDMDPDLKWNAKREIDRRNAAVRR